MFTPCRLLQVALSATVVLAWGVARAQEADSDQAAALLKQGVAQFDVKDYGEAKATLLKVDRQLLPDPDKARLDQLLAQADVAIRRKSAGMEAFDNASKAMRDNQLDKARRLFQQVAQNEYLPEPVRKDARTQLALVERKLAAQPPAEKPAEKPVEKPVEQPADLAQAAAAAPPEQPAPRLLTAEEPPAAAPPVATAPAEVPTAQTAPAEAAVAEVKPVEAAPSEAAPVPPAPAEVAPVEAGPAEAVPAPAPVVAEAPPPAPAPEGGILSELQRNRKILRQRADVELESNLQRAAEILRTAKSAEEFQLAANTLQVARNVLERNRELYSAVEHQERIQDIARRLEEAQTRRESWERSRVEEQRQQIAQAEEQRVRQAQEQRRQKVRSLTEQVDALRDAQKYQEALEVARQTVQLEPGNDWAARQVDMLQAMVLLQTQREVRDTRAGQEVRELTELEDAEIAWVDRLRFPKDWEQMRQYKQGAAAEGGYGSEEDRKIRERLRNETLATLEFPEGTQFEDAISYLREVTGLNIQPNWPAIEGSEAAYKRDMTIKIEPMTKVTIEKALEQILEYVSGINMGQETQLVYVIHGGRIVITTKAALNAPEYFYTVVYRIDDLTRALALANYDFTGFEEEQQGGAETGGTQGQQEQVTGQETEGQEEQLTSQQIADRMQEMITTTIDQGSWFPTGQGQAVTWAQGRHLIVTQTAANHQAIADLLSQLREAKEIQVSIDTRFITVSTGFLNSVGVDLDFFFNIGSRLGSTALTDPWTGATVPGMGGMSGWGTDHPSNAKFTPVPVRQGSSAFTNMVGVSSPAGASSIGSLINSQAMTVSGTFLDDIQVDFLIQATQAHQTTRATATPRITLMSGTAAHLYVGRTVNYIPSASVSYVTTGAGANLQTIPLIEYGDQEELELGTTLDIAATVSADLKYVTLTVNPWIRRLNALNWFPFNPQEILEGGGELPAGYAFVQTPDVSVQTATTTVAVPDGGTLLLGGLRSAGEVEREMGVPLLSKIPIINRAFTNRGSVKDEETLLILIKPTIIVPRDEEERLFPTQ